MAAPTLTAPATPLGYKLPEGFVALIVFAANPTVSLFIKSAKPPGWDVGDGIDQTTMSNVNVMTSYPPALAKATDLTLKCGYDPKVYGQLLPGAGLTGINNAISFYWPDGVAGSTASSVALWGFLKKIEFDELKPKTFPECTVVIEVTNYDFVNKVQALPVYTDDTVPGT